MLQQLYTVNYLEQKQMHANFVNSSLKTNSTNRSDKKLAKQIKQQNKSRHTRILPPPHHYGWTCELTRGTHCMVVKSM